MLVRAELSFITETKQSGALVKTRQKTWNEKQKQKKQKHYFR